MEENSIPKRVLYMNLESTRPSGRPRNRWQDEVWEDGRKVGGEEWQEKVLIQRYERRSSEWQGIIRILHTPMELMNTSVSWDGIHKDNHQLLCFINLDLWGGGQQQEKIQKFNRNLLAPSLD
jgi:hypothetical protein